MLDQNVRNFIDYKVKKICLKTMSEVDFFYKLKPHITNDSFRKTFIKNNPHLFKKQKSRLGEKEKSLNDVLREILDTKSIDIIINNNHRLNAFHKKMIKDRVFAN